MLKRTLVLLEIIAVFFAGTLAARALLKFFGITGSKDAIRGAISGKFDWVAVAAPMSIRWAIVIGLAFLVGWLVARHRPRDYGLTLAGRPLPWHLGAGMLSFAFGFLPVVLALLARHHFDLPGGPAIWKTLDTAERDLDFWLFMLASSIVLPPLFEETYFRGYAQTRLGTAFRPLTGITIISVLFVAAHVQYLDGTFMSTLFVSLGIWQFIVLGYARLRTGSLIAPIFAHAVGNISMRPPEQWALAAVLAVVLVWALTRGRHSLLAGDAVKEG